MAQVGIRELLEAGVHFGHQTRRWNPKMRRFIFGERGGIHIIDLQQTERLLKQAQDFAEEVASRGGTVLFVGTKKQARDAVKEAAEKGGMPYVNQRWLGGLLTNFQTINRRIRRLHQLTDWTTDGTLELLPTRERIGAINEREKLEMNLGGVRDMQRPPDAVFIVDLKTEAIAVREAERLRIPIIGLVDTNVDPDAVTYPIPGNDDAIRSCKVIVDAIGDVVAERATRFRAEEEAARREREEQERREAEERAKREAEERERQEAAQREADEKARAQAAQLEAQEQQREQEQQQQEQQAAAQPEATAPQATGGEAAAAEQAPPQPETGNAPQPAEGQPPSEEQTQEQQENAAEQGVSQ
ncbi:MAG TPA: 30S ribosomal protein S2 [Thermoleophilaceae bacterium]|nr:30S ribosomal protein S2 [Thermoleophilaceae bacterium]